jgi:uncharacterized protein (UPF0335 family)
MNQQDPQLTFPPVVSDQQVVYAAALPMGEDPTGGPQHRHVQTVATREVALKQQVKDLIQKLGEAIHESVADSEPIAEVVKEIRQQGFDVLLMLEATIGLNEVEDEEETATDEEGNETAVGPFTNNDLTFLRSLRITTEDHTSEGDGAEPDETPGPA